MCVWKKWSKWKLHFKNYSSCGAKKHEINILILFLVLTWCKRLIKVRKLLFLYLFYLLAKLLEVKKIISCCAHLEFVMLMKKSNLMKKIKYSFYISVFRKKKNFRSLISKVRTRWRHLITVKYFDPHGPLGLFMYAEFGTLVLATQTNWLEILNAQVSFCLFEP